MILVAPKSLSALTCCPLPCIFHPWTSWMICTKSGLSVPHRYWFHIGAGPSTMTLELKVIQCGCMSFKVADKVLWAPLLQQVLMGLPFIFRRLPLKITAHMISWHSCFHWAYWACPILNSQYQGCWNYWNWWKWFPQVQRWMVRSCISYRRFSETLPIAIPIAVLQASSRLLEL